MASAGRILMFPVGDWISGNDYGILDIVYHEGSSYIAKANINSSTTPPPEDTTNWQIQARGFGADALSEITAKDTSGVLGTAGATVVSQALIDAIADRVMTKLFPIANLVNNGLTTQAGFALDARYGKTLKDLLDQTNSNLTNISSRIDSGSIVFDFQNANTVSKQVTFSRVFISAPKIVTQVKSGTNQLGMFNTSVSEVSTTGFTINFKTTVVAAYTVDWHAIL